MADLKDVIDKLQNEGNLVRNKGAHSIKSVKEIMLSSQVSPAQQKQDREDTRNFQNSLLQNMAGAAGAGAGGAGDVKPDTKAGGAFAGIAKGLGGLGKGIAKGIGGFMAGLGNVVAAGKFAIAFPLFGVGIAGFAVALGGAVWLISKMMPSIADGLKKFEDINGKNLIDVGLGMSALGVGFAAMGAGKAISGVGNLIGGIADGVGGLFGAKSGQEDIMEKLKKFSKVELDVKNIKGNAEAMTAYGIAMTAGSAGSMLGTLATLADGAIGGLGKLLGGVPVVDQLIAFSKVDVDGKKVKKNADAMMGYANAMTVGAGASAMKGLASVGNLISSGIDSLSKSFGGKGTLETQLSDMKKMSDASDSIDGKKVRSIADAMMTYAVAMTAGLGASAMKGLASVGNLLSGAFDGLSTMFGGKSTLDNQIADMKKLSIAGSDPLIDGKAIKNIADTMVVYADAMSAAAKGTSSKAWGDIANFAGGMAKSIGGFLGIKDADPIGDLKKFSLKSITEKEVTSIKSLAAGLKAYSEATQTMAKLAVDEGFGESVSNLLSGIGGWFSSGDKEDPLAAFEKFAGKKFDAKQAEENVKSLQSFANFKYNRTKNGWISFARDLAQSVPVIEASIIGTEKVKFFGRNIKMKGLGSPDINFEEAKLNINKLKTALKIEAVSADSSAKPNDLKSVSADSSAKPNDLKSTENDSLRLSIDALTAQIAAMPVGGGNTTNAPTTINRAGDVHTAATTVHPRAGTNGNSMTSEVV